MRSWVFAVVVRWWSVLLAGTLATFLTLEALLSDREPIGLAISYLAIACLAFARWARGPAAIGAMLAFVAGAFIDAAAVFEVGTAGVIGLTATSVFGSLPDRRERLLGLAGGLGALTILMLNVPADAPVLDRDSRAQIIIVNAILFTIGWAVTWMLTSRVRSAAELRERASRLERERDAAAEAAVAEERARIARELHDVVAHSVSVMTVQAGGVRRLLGDGEGHEREREALASIEETGRRALAEMRRMVTVMRASGARPELAPQPGVAALPRLVDEVCEAGLPVTLTVDGAADLPPGIDLSVYRIVQEALTNVRKHAGPAHAHVTVALGPSAVEVVVDDDGAGAGGRNGGGHGLIGMRERVAVYGGELESGDRPGGGFRVRALLPLDQPPGVGA